MLSISVSWTRTVNARFIPKYRSICSPLDMPTSIGGKSEGKRIELTVVKDVKNIMTSLPSRSYSVHSACFQSS
jgi:predicted alpha/beta-hydrolase family hydrolase